MRLDFGSPLRQFHNLRLAQGGLMAFRLGDANLLGAAIGQGADGQLFLPNLLAEDAPIPLVHMVQIGRDQARHQRLAQPKAGIYGGRVPLACHGVGREQNARHLWLNHLLHHDR